MRVAASVLATRIQAGHQVLGQMSSLPKGVLDAAWEEFENAITGHLVRCSVIADLRIERHSAAEIDDWKRGVVAAGGVEAIVSLDTYAGQLVQPSSGIPVFHLGVSRHFLEDGSQHLDKITSRPGWSELPHQIARFKAWAERHGITEATLNDDDVFGGGTAERVIKLLEEGGRVHIDQVLVGISGVASVAGWPVRAYRQYELGELGENVDFRDFCIGALHGGEVRTCGCQISRVPEVGPLGHPKERASIAADRKRDFSYAVWGCNFALHQKIGTLDLPIRLLMPNSENVLARTGLPEGATVGQAIRHFRIAMERGARA
jgi:hypothetical protein